MPKMSYICDKDFRPSNAPYGIDDKLFSCKDLKYKIVKTVTEILLIFYR